MEERTRRSPQKRVRQKGTGACEPRGPGRWLIRYNSAPPGEPRVFENETIHGTKKVAEDRLRDLIAAAAKGGVASKGRMTFAELAAQFIAAKRVSKEPTTVHLYERGLRLHILPVIGGIEVRKLSDKHLNALLRNARDTSQRKRKGQPLSPTSLRILRTLVSSILEYGVRHDVVIRNVAKLVEAPVSAYTEQVPLTTGYALSILNAVKGKDLEALVTVALYSGMRRGEILGLRVSDVNFETGAYHIARAVKNLGTKFYVGKLKTESSERWDVMPEDALACLRVHRLRQRERHLAFGGVEDPHLFDDGAGGPMNPNEVSRLFARFIRSTTLRPCRFHDLRHLHVTMSFKANVPLKTTSRSVGHSKTAITVDLYTHLAGDEFGQKAVAVNDLLRSEREKTATKAAG
jgi:integrase